MDSQILKLNGGKLKFALPRFHASLDNLDEQPFGCNLHMTEFFLGSQNEVISGMVQEYTCDFKDGYRHISLSELSELFQPGADHQKSKVLAELLLAYYLDSDNQRHVIWVSDGVRREGEDVILFKKIDGCLECLTEAAYDTTTGYKINNTNLKGEKFNLERLFRKYDEHNLTLKMLDKSNPDFVEVLFGKEYEKLPQFIQQASFALPPDVLQKKDDAWKWGEADIWPLGLNMGLHSNENNIRKAKARASINPYGKSCQFHVAVKEI